MGIETETKHVPVLLQEATDFLEVKPGGTYVDMTLGGGGHSLEIIRRLEGSGNLVAIDADAKAIERFKAKIKLMGFEAREFWYEKEKLKVYLVDTNFERLIEIIAELGISEVDGILADLGTSTDQLEDSKKGFSFKKDEELDMRMNDGLSVKAKDLVNVLNERQLADMFFEFGDENYAKRIAREIVETRKSKLVETTFDLLKIIEKALPKNSHKPYGKRELRDLLPATRVFQALRIAVNHELDSLKTALPQTLEVMVAGSRLVVISFHSGEDRIVKNFFRDEEKKGTLRILTDKPIEPTEKEIVKNRKSRSAKMRTAEKI